MHVISKITMAMSLVALVGCSTVSRGVTDYLRIDSVPQGAKVTTTLETKASRLRSYKNVLAKKEYISCPATPCTLEVYRRKNFAIKIEHRGFEPAEIAIGGAIQQDVLGVNMAANMGGGLVTGVTMGALVGGFEVAFAQGAAGFINIFSHGAVQATANTSGLVAGATSTGATIGTGVGLGMIAVDVVSGANANIYPNPVIVQLASEGTPTVKDPNMLMYNLRRAKERRADKYCANDLGVSKALQKRNCNRAKALDKQRDIDNADILSREGEIKALIKKLKKQIQAQKRAARKRKRAG